MLYLKVMQNVDRSMPDDSVYANFSIFQIPERSAVSFGQSDVNPEGVKACWFDEGGLQTIELTGNAYLMNGNGKTIAHRTCDFDYPKPPSNKPSAPV